MTSGFGYVVDLLIRREHQSRWGDCALWYWQRRLCTRSSL
jgi:hypothetical protein